MNKQGLLPAIIFLSILFPAAARAQERDAPKVEAGVQFTSLGVRPPGFFGTDNQPGFGGRVTYNFNDYFAVEAEANYFPGGTLRAASTGGDIGQAQFGVKAGRRFNRFGLFAKARPGFVSHSQTVGVREERVTLPPGTVIPFARFDAERKTHFSMDVGGVLELYPSRRLVVRFDAGDTIVRYGERDEANFVFPVPPGEGPVVTLPSEVRHNFQFSAGLGFRFGGGGGPAEDASAAPDSSDPERRFEAGVQFSSLSLRVPRPVNTFPVIGPGVEQTTNEAGFGARVGYNLTGWLAVEAEGNFYPRRTFAFFSRSSTGGYPAQMQFGVKAGRRFRRFGLFAKARPGFVTFSRVSQVVRTETFDFGGGPVTFGVFEDRRKTYFSADVGGVLELYPARRFFTRFDFGDTIIRYSERQQQGFLPSLPVVNLAPETQHNFQFAAGLGMRF